MAVLPRYDTPGFQNEFPNDPQKQEEFQNLWSANVNRWANAALIGDIWDLTNYGPRPAFYNPLVTDTPSNATVAGIPWHAFPGRLSAFFPNNPFIYEWADTGQIPEIALNLCTQQAIPWQPYGPTGPRGWQDEYCEWTVTRNASNKITSIMFTCENPEYWLTLWQLDPAAVLGLYQQLVNPIAKLSELYLLNPDTGKPVVDPSTGRPAYNPLNHWNYGTQTLPTIGGAVHLTSRPNTLGAEFDLAAAATIPRTKNGNPVTSASELVCCAKYGQIGRQSDPTIGQNVNSFVNSSGLQGARATLTNPPGLYMQSPDFTGFVTPDQTPAGQFWNVVRGRLKDPNVSYDIDRILHATFAVPASKGYTVSDIKIDGAQIAYASQIAVKIGMALSATVFPGGGPNQQALPCTLINQSPPPAAAVLQYADIFAAARAAEVEMYELPLSFPVLSLSVPRGAITANIALNLNTNDTPDSATITVDGGGVTVTVTGKTTVAGNINALLISIAVDANAALGDRGILVNVPGQPTSTQPAIGLLNIVEAVAPQAVPTRTASALTAKSSPTKPHFRNGRG